MSFFKDIPIKGMMGFLEIQLLENGVILVQTQTLQILKTIMAMWKPSVIKKTKWLKPTLPF